MTDGLWLHAVARGPGPTAPAGLADVTGIGGEAVRTVAAAGLLAVVSPVDLAEFGEAALRRNLENLAWLEGVARSHHAVVAAAGRLGAVVPATLATVYRDDDGVRAMLQERHGDFEAVLERIEGRAEWGVKAYAEPAPAPSVAADARPGVAYLQRRRAQLTADDERLRRAREGAEEVHAALAGGAVAARRHPPQDRRLTGRGEPMVLNGAYLVAGGVAFGEAVDAQAERHPELHLELTGPWPPYSFASAEDEHETRDEDQEAPAP
ncbi:GvpL/GvpF family gas vesicle protein [Dactylosporangium sp. CA-139066]|uniref:GvpL/GvpF family gas vesicle protein n=1 Tax=Dactylosporangium sp. CA-139066 TaxID=3239930 RepID=UPI003D90AA31